MISKLLLTTLFLFQIQIIDWSNPCYNNYMNAMRRSEKDHKPLVVLISDGYSFDSKRAERLLKQHKSEWNIGIIEYSAETNEACKQFDPLFLGETPTVVVYVYQEEHCWYQGIMRKTINIEHLEGMINETF